MRLLESQPEKRARFAGGTVFSIVLHFTLIFLAVFATARAGVKKVNRERAEKVNFVAVKKEPPPPPEVKKEPPPPKKEVPKPKAPKPQLPRLPKEVAVAPPKGFQVVPPVINIPTRLPSIDLSKAVTRESDFSGKGVEGGTLRILKSSDPAFSDAVKRALPGMRFSAAQIGGRKVKQLVQMPFVFNIKT
jgi:protein TonB